VSTVAPVPTAGLSRVVKASLKIQAIEDSFTWIQLPKRLAAGWYLVTETWAGVPRQAVLQVTDIATFSMLGDDKSAVWVNNLATKKAAAAATVTVDGRRLGATDKRGLLVAATPATLKLGETPSSSPILVVRSGSQSAFQPFSTSRYCAFCASPTTDDQWWQLFSSDRSTFRSTDTVDAWGVVRNRDTGKVPSSVTVTLRTDEGSREANAAISTTSASPDANGAFSVRVALKDLPVGSYRLMLSAGKAQLGELWLQVATIAKPAFQMEMTTDRHAVVSGDKVAASVQARFFEGTPVAGMELTLFSSGDGEGGSGNAKVRTDAMGDASGSVTVRVDAEDGEQWSVTAVQAIPALPEEAEIATMSEVAVFRATAVVDTAAAVAGTRINVTGKVSDVAFDRYETAAPNALWEVDPRGGGRANAEVQIRIVQRTVVRRQTGTTYDFILKQVSPVYGYTEREETVARRTVHTGADGTFRLSETVLGGNRSYEVFATYRDEEQRQVTGSAWAQGPQLDYGSRDAWLEVADPEPMTADGAEYSVGEAVRVRFMGGLKNAPVSRYFYAITQRGLTYATVGTRPTFRTTFTDASVPAIQITGV
ncbi:MAG: hypothetical protein MUQ32_04385, partial [Chloroflexi bacterium]|nr:hypothetical protein [Chloroflexota bacterium]